MRCDIDRLGIESLGHQSEMVPLLTPAAQAVKQEAIRTAPVQKEKPHGGDRPGMYRASIYARVRTSGGVKVYHVGSDNKVAWWVETGSHHGKQRAQHILLKAVRKAGLRVVPDIAE